MGIRIDAGEILGLVYNKYVSENFGGVNSENLFKETGWEKDRVKRAVDYLRQKELIKVNLYLGGNFWIQTINPKGVDIIEYPKKFKDVFGFNWNKKREISKDKKVNNKKKIMLWIFFVIILSATIYLLIDTQLIKNFKDILIKNFGKPLTSKLIWAFILSTDLAILLGGVFLVCREIFPKNNKWKNNWFLLTICLILFTIIFGFFAIDYSIGNQNISLYLFEPETKDVAGIIECGGDAGPIIVGSKLICKTNLNKKEQFIINKEEIYPVFTLSDGNEKVSEVVPENAVYLSFNVFETYTNGTGAFFMVGYPYEFINDEGFKKNREKFIQVFLALIAVAFVTIPIAMINLRNLWRSRLSLNN